MQKQMLWLAVALGAALPSVGAAAPTAAIPDTAKPPAVTLRYKFTPGQTRTYLFTMDLEGTFTGGPQGRAFPLNQHMEAVMHQTVQSVRASDGAATIASRLDGITMVMNGRPVSMTDAQTAQIKQVPAILMSPSGKVLSVVGKTETGSGTVPGMTPGSVGLFQSGGSLPEKPVQVGDSWNSTASVAMANAQVVSNYALTGLETANGTDVADVAMTFQGTLSPGPASGPVQMAGKIDGTGSEQFDVAAGALDRVETTTRIAMTIRPKPQAQGAPMLMQTQVRTRMVQQKP